MIARSGLRVAVDPMYGAGRGYIARWLRELGVMVAEIHGELNPGFGGLHPEPIGRNLEELSELVRKAATISGWPPTAMPIASARSMPTASSSART